MGGLISAPLTAAGTCLGGCFGSCMATGCCKLAGSGTVSTARAARFVLIWLQVFIAALALFLSATAVEWLPGTCKKMDSVGMGGVGICNCRSSAEPSDLCWQDQMIYRSEASGCIVFAALMFMTFSGCAQGAARSHAVAKFMAVVLLIFISLFLPNKWATAFGSVATAASAIFLVAQAVLLIDFGYAWNELWYSNAIEARRREVGQRSYRLWLGAMLLASASMTIGGLIMSVYFYVVFPDTGSRAVNVTAMVLSVVFLMVSITDWCEHGALLTSSVVIAYTTWLISEALAVVPTGTPLQLPAWAGLSLCSLSLLSTAGGAGGWGSSSSGSAESTAPAATASPSLIAAAEAGEVDRHSAQADESADQSEAWRFGAQCGVHASAALYVAAELAPRTGSATFGLRVAAVFLSLVLYGWSLVAPKVLTGRRFN
eukprot:CAMPEP_0115101206 /NCGR_PEP_ID=MMETSP0227-20121206/33070_1 /TAXON_ID=89957 /ORGANISM="Polarella glacialis, Strain CCMP 1383" /LENGTH=428 /DNA_ID=CAMNT_0002496865 /DNA_START=70 /DNA_END=1356 /DNA_ORIENTATION=+